MPRALQQILEHTAFDACPIRERTAAIYEQVLRESRHMDAANFACFHPQDLQRMFDLYDGSFFGGGCRRLLGDVPLKFAISRRMTQAAGKTTCWRHRDRLEPVLEYGISVSSTLLFQTFRGQEREVTVSGLVCHDRLQALQRVMEHEIVHLLEMLLWTKSSCTQARFKSIAFRFFGHTQHTHRLVTPRETAWEQHGVRAGDLVRFRFDGRHYTGVVRRITKRASVLVEDPSGTPYTNGKRYRKFYVPLTMLEPIDG